MADEILLRGPIRDAILSGPGGIPYQAGPDGALRVRPAHLAWARDLGFAPDVPAVVPDVPAPASTPEPDPTPEPAPPASPAPAADGTPAL